MVKTDLVKIIAVTQENIYDFIFENHGVDEDEEEPFDGNMAITLFHNELNYLEDNNKKGIEIINPHTTWKVIVDELEYEGWIKLFTETQELTQDYYILYVD